VTIGWSATQEAAGKIGRKASKRAHRQALFGVFQKQLGGILLGLACCLSLEINIARKLRKKEALLNARAANVQSLPSAPSTAAPVPMMGPQQWLSEEWSSVEFGADLDVVDDAWYLGEVVVEASEAAEAAELGLD